MFSGFEEILDLDKYLSQTGQFGFKFVFVRMHNRPGSWLFIMVKTGQIQKARSLISSDADIATTDSACSTPLQHAPREIGILLPNNQRQHRTLHIQKDVLPYALC